MLSRKLIAALLSSALLLPAIAEARQPADKPYTQLTEPKEADLQEHGHYTNGGGESVHSPAHSKSGAVPAGASAQCRDGTYSFSRNHRGTCSHHGGVGQWLN